jgi:hypothetical protein
MKIKYLDQIIILNGFQTVDQIKAVAPRVVEAVGYLVKETDDGYMLASTVNGAAYNNLLFIPKAVVQSVSEDDIEGVVEAEYFEVQGINKQVPATKVETLPAPPIVKLIGFEAYRDADTIYIAQEKNVDGKFKTITAVPLKFLKK